MYILVKGKVSQQTSRGGREETEQITRNLFWNWGFNQLTNRIRVQSSEPEFVNFLGIDSKESIPPAYVAWQACSINRVFVSARKAT
jgi:hypothetical protein